MNGQGKYSPRILHAGLLALIMFLSPSVALPESAERVFRIDAVDATARVLSIRGEDVYVSENVTIDLERTSGARNPIRFENLEPRQYIRVTVRHGLLIRITVLEGSGNGDGVL